MPSHCSAEAVSYYRNTITGFHLDLSKSSPSAPPHPVAAGLWGPSGSLARVPITLQRFFHLSAKHRLWLLAVHERMERRARSMPFVFVNREVPCVSNKDRVSVVWKYQKVVEQ